MVEILGLTMTALRDEDQRSIDSLRLVQPGGAPGGEDAPVPTSILADSEGVVLRYDRADYIGVRPNPDTMLALVDRFIRQSLDI